MRIAAIIFFIAVFSSNSAFAQKGKGHSAGVSVKHDTVRKAVRVEIDGELFTELLYNQFEEADIPTK